MDENVVTVAKDIRFPENMLIQDDGFSRGWSDVKQLLEDCHRAVLEHQNDKSARQRLVQVRRCSL